MKFGENMDLRGANSNYERAVRMLKESKPSIGTDTKQSEDNRFFIFNMEVTEPEYNKFLDQYNAIMEREIEERKMAA